MNQYIVTVANFFAADSPEDALRQMVAYLDDYRTKAGYRVENYETGASSFIDAKTVNFNEVTP